MPQKNKESQYSQRLRELGFVSIDKEFSVSVRATLAKQLSRKERRLLQKKGYKPWFSQTDIVTFATDETGQSWQGPPNTDLSPLGFEDKSAAVQGDLKAYRAKDRRYN